MTMRTPTPHPHGMQYMRVEEWKAGKKGKRMKGNEKKGQQN